MGGDEKGRVGLGGAQGEGYSCDTKRINCNNQNEIKLKYVKKNYGLSKGNVGDRNGTHFYG